MHPILLVSGAPSLKNCQMRKEENPMSDVTPSIGENEKPLLLTNRKKIFIIHRQLLCYS